MSSRTVIRQDINVGQVSGADGGPAANLASIQVIGQINFGPVAAMETILQVTPGPRRLNAVIMKTFAAALNLTGGDQGKAAEMLGVSRSTIWAFVNGNKEFNYGRSKKRKEIGEGNGTQDKQD